jgi:hypothetical protein
MTIFNIVLIVVTLVSIAAAIYFFRTRKNLGVIYIPEDYFDLFVKYGMPPALKGSESRWWIERRLKNS